MQKDALTKEVLTSLLKEAEKEKKVEDSKHVADNS